MCDILEDKYKVKSFSVNTLLLSVFLVFFTSSISVADDSLTLRQTTVDLTSSKITDQLVLDLYLSQPEEFYVSISTSVSGRGNDRNFFYMKPISGTGGKNQVKLALDLPYEQITPGGSYRTNTVNSVVNKTESRLATNVYSSCPATRNPYGGGRVCKPLSFLIVDMDSVPGTTYGVDLDVEITTRNHTTVLRDTIYVTYTNMNSPIGIYSHRDRLSLKPENNFMDSSTFCVFSRSKLNFDVRLEGEQKNEQLILRGSGQHYLPYSIRLDFNRHNQPDYAKPFEWISGGRVINAKNSLGCLGRKNLEVQALISPETVRNTKPGQYSGVLTVRVRAL